ncbi:MAG: RNA methyltransferase [Cyanobacteria bacterium MAG CAR3_bin_5]|nr:RNA methyltransferase [Cyanobacteria bacterium MAG CAR3_bin_5]
MTLPQELVVSTLLRARVQDDQGADHGVGHQVWMHPPTHRVLGWASRPTSFGPTRSVWRLNQLRHLQEDVAVVSETPARTQQSTLDLLPTLMDAHLYGHDGLVLGRVVDAVVNTKTGAIGHYLVARSDPRLPGASRWRLQPNAILDQQPGRVVAVVGALDDLPLARAGLRTQALQAGQRWRERFQDTTVQAGRRLEDWLHDHASLPRDHGGPGARGRREDMANPPGSDRRPEREVWDEWEHPPHRRPSPHRDREIHDPDQEPWL